MTFTAPLTISSQELQPDQNESVSSVLAAQTINPSRDISQTHSGDGTVEHPVADFSKGMQRARAVSFVTTLPLRLDVRIPMPNFRFKDLAHLQAGQVLETAWQVSEDLPVAAGDVRLLWAEFSVAEQQLTVRVTRVA